MADVASVADYADVGLLAAVRDGQTSADVAAMKYRQIAALCGVTIKPDGGSPEGFRHEPIRRRIVAGLVALEHDARRDELVQLIQAGLAGKNARCKWSENEGRIVIIDDTGVVGRSG